MSTRRATGAQTVEACLELSRADGCMVVVRESSSANLRWAGNTLTTNGVGLVLGTLFRFWSYRRFVWAAPEDVEAADADGDAAAHAVREDLRTGTIHPPSTTPGHR